MLALILALVIAFTPLLAVVLAYFWRRRFPPKERSAKPFLKIDPWGVGVFASNGSAKILTYRDPEIHVTLSQLGVATLGEESQSPSLYHLVFGKDKDNGVYFRCLSEAKPLFRGGNIESSAEHRHYLRSEWPLPLVIDFPLLPNVQALVGQSESDPMKVFQLLWTVAFGRRLS